ncbi:uncharacterized protein RAG0_09053 [Rhynchosporium agropyri]|uniref:Uncharacterized protein n=1 Tax=Rhynchosporium agropyri TaxID=914238 RepID=A0A1E1KTK8_9HELO|nr:uncharacterized protein RAG0_09053 [Rhynchosporium agropyri]
MHVRSSSRPCAGRNISLYRFSIFLESYLSSLRTRSRHEYYQEKTDFALSTILRFTSSGTSGSQIYLLKYATFQKGQGTGDIDDPHASTETIDFPQSSGCTDMYKSILHLPPITSWLIGTPQGGFLTPLNRRREIWTACFDLSPSQASITISQ